MAPATMNPAPSALIGDNSPYGSSRPEKANRQRKLRNRLLSNTSLCQAIDTWQNSRDGTHIRVDPKISTILFLLTGREASSRSGAFACYLGLFSYCPLSDYWS